MSVTLYASLAQFKGTVGESYLDGAYHKIADQTGDNGSTKALQVAATQIKGALTRGGYSNDSVEAYPTTWPLLTQLNCDLAAIRLVLGAAGSNIADAKNQTMGSLIELTNQQIKDLKAGRLDLSSTEAGVDDISAPHASRSIVVSDRSTGADLVDHSDWYPDNPIDEDRYGEYAND